MQLVPQRLGRPAEAVANRRPHASLGLRQGNWDFSVWLRNLANEHYLQNVTVQAGNSGLILGTPNDPRMFGVTIRGRY